MTAPCDSPKFPLDLVDQLSQALIIQDLDLVYAATIEDDQIQTYPVFALMKLSVISSFTHFLIGGGRKIDQWFKSMNTAHVVFDDVKPFANINTIDELRPIQT